MRATIIARPRMMAKNTTTIDDAWPILKYENAVLNRYRLIVSDDVPGPPCVMTKMTSNDLRESIKRKRRAVMIEGRIKGRVMYHNSCQRLSPSIIADSYGSCGSA